MIIKRVKEKQKASFDKAVSHVIQTWQWGEFRKKTGLQVERIGVFEGQKLKSAYQITFHQIPKTNFTVGYLPKCLTFSPKTLDFLSDLGKEKNAIFIKIEPDVESDKATKQLSNVGFSKYPKLKKSPKTIFAPHTFFIDLSKSEEELFSAMHSKTRYNIRLAQKHGVTIEEKSDDRSFEKFLKLQRETAQRQGFFIHPDSYYRKMWQNLKPAGMAHLILAKYKGKVLATWVLLRFKDTLYYPYGGSSQEYKNVMASNLLAWEAILLGKKLGCKTFDFWGALSQNPNPADPWFGFHRFKAGYGGRLATYVGTYDLVINSPLYQVFLIVDKLRWFFLKLKQKI